MSRDYEDGLYHDPGMRIAVEPAFRPEDYHGDVYYDRYRYYSQPTTQRVRLEDDYRRPHSPLPRPSFVRAKSMRPPSPVSAIPYDRIFDPRAKSVSRFEDANSRTSGRQEHQEGQERRLSPLPAVRRTSSYAAVQSKSVRRESQWYAPTAYHSDRSMQSSRESRRSSTTTEASNRLTTAHTAVTSIKYQSIPKTKTSSADTPNKRLFLTASKDAVGLLMDNVYNVFKLKKRETHVRTKTPWNMRLVVYAGGERTQSTMTCTVYDYDASRGFAMTFLRRAMKIENLSKVYSSVPTRTLKKTFGRDVTKLKDDIEALGDKYQQVNDAAEPNRRSTVCLFRENCKKTSICIYCKLEALHNKINYRGGVRITKQFLCKKDRNSVLDKLVTKIANEKREKDISASSDSSSSEESSSSSSSSSESSDSSSESSSSGSKSSTTTKKTTRFSRKRRIEQKKSFESKKTRGHVERKETSITHTCETTMEAPPTTTDGRRKENDETGKHDDDDNVFFLSAEIDWDPDRA